MKIKMVIFMAERNSYKWLLDKYPPIINKEQLYRICHVSKKTAQAYLEFKFIPSRNTGKKTWKYSIKLTDVIAFLELRDQAPCDYLIPPNWGRGKQRTNIAHLTPEVRRNLHKAFEIKLDSYPDVLSGKQVACVTGYTISSVTKWCKNGQLYHYRILGKNMIPKIVLLEFLDSVHFHSIRVKSAKHLQMILQAQKATPLKGEK